MICGNTMGVGHWPAPAYTNIARYLTNIFQIELSEQKENPPPLLALGFIYILRTQHYNLTLVGKMPI